MWRLTATLLVLGLASASPNYNYFNPGPPIRPLGPIGPINPVCPVITSVIYNTRVQTSRNIQTVNKANTRFVTTTVFRQGFGTTTVFQTRVETRTQFQTSLLTTTTDDFRDQVVTRTVQDQGGQNTRFVTTTRFVQQVSFVTTTQFQTQGVPVTITTTQFNTINQPFTNFFTQTLFDTRVVTVPGRDVVQTRVQTVLFTSLVRDTQQANTRFVTTTFIQTQVQSIFVPGQNVVSTRVVQSQQIVPFTSFNSRFETAFTTSELVSTSFNVVTQTSFQSQVLEQTITQTRVVPTTIYTTIYRTRFQPITRGETVVRTGLITGAPVLQTKRRVTTSIIQIPGPDRILTRQVVQTKHQQQLIYNTVTKDKVVAVTRTVTGHCDYDREYDNEYPTGTTPFDPYYN